MQDLLLPVSNHCIKHCKRGPSMSVAQTVENVYVRQNAIQLTRRFFWRLLGMAVIVYAAVNGLNYLLTLLGDALMAPEIEALLAAQPTIAQRMTSYDPMLEALLSMFSSPKFLLYNFLCIIVTELLSNGLTMGRLRQQICTGRGESPRVPGVFQQMRFCLKAWGLNLWMGLKIMLWALPGLAVFFTGAALQASNADFSVPGSLLGWGGLLLMFILTIRAALNYSQAAHLLADEPERTIRDCIAFSTGLMKGRKWQYFKVGIPPILKAAGIFLAVYTVIGLPLGLAGLTANPLAARLPDLTASLAAVYFILQLDMVYALYYLKLREPVEEKPVSYWLRDHTAADSSSDSPADFPEETPEDASLITNDRTKENDHEQSDC